MACSGKSKQCTAHTVDEYEPEEELKRNLTKYLENVQQAVAVLVDYDVGLQPDSETHQVAPIPEELKQILKKLTSHPAIKLGIISGKEVNVLKDKFAIDNITYAGSNGLEVKFADGTTYTHDIPAQFNEKIAALSTQLEQAAPLKPYKVWVENKMASLTLHYEKVPPDARTAIQQTAKNIIGENFKIAKAIGGALDVGPKVDWDKGKVVVMILNKIFGPSWTDKAKVIFVGGDASDEDVLELLTNKAATFRITPTKHIRTYAEHILPSTEALSKVLQIVETIVDKNENK